jgi:hypothetical protein
MASKYLLGIPSTVFILMGLILLAGNIAVLIPVLTDSFPLANDRILAICIQMISASLYLTIGIGVRKEKRSTCIAAAIFSIFWIIISPVYLLTKIPITLFVNGLMFFGIVLHFRKTVIANNADSMNH